VNTLKPMLIFAVLIGVCYGVYSRINHKPSAPPEAMVHWDNTEPTVQMPESMDGSGEHKAPGPLGHSFMAGSLPGGGGSASGQPSGGQMVDDPRAASWEPAGAGGVGNAQYDPSSGGAIGSSGPSQGYDNTYGQPPVGSPDGTYGQTLPGQDGGSYGQLPAAGLNDPTSADPSMRGGVDSFPAGSDAGRSGAPLTPFAAALDQARHELDAGRLPEAHYQLSRWYDNPNLNQQEAQQLNDLLDQLAGTVIYSTQNLMEPACEVQQGETLERIAQRYNVPWQLLAKINGIDDPHSLRPGERLKVVRGPFSAVISLEKHTLTLMLNNAYAGRFSIGVGRDSPPPEGQYFVDVKVVDPIYYGPGRTIERGDPANPLGRRWLGLGGQLGIHGTNDPRSIGQTDIPGSISLADRDIDDVFDILSEHSKVVVRR
jgi:LysM domain/L,D-transpeptidase catalytic domain